MGGHAVHQASKFGQGFGRCHDLADFDGATRRWIGHPGGHVTPVIGVLDEELPIPSLAIERDCSHLLTEQRMQRIRDFDGARIAGII